MALWAVGAACVAARTLPLAAARLAVCRGLVPAQGQHPDAALPGRHGRADRAQRPRLLLLAEGRALARRPERAATTSATSTTTRRSRARSRTRASRSRPRAAPRPTAPTCADASSPRCSCTAACCTSAATCCSCGSSATTSRTRWGRAKFLAFYLLGGRGGAGAADRDRPGLARCRPSARRARSRACSAATCCCSRGARVMTVIFIVFFFTIIELPALVVLGFWFVQQVAVRLLRPRHRPARAAASRTSRTSAASLFGLLAIQLFADERKRRRAERARARDGRGASILGARSCCMARARVPDALRAVHERARTCSWCSRCWSSRVLGVGVFGALIRAAGDGRGEAPLARRCWRSSSAAACAGVRRCSAGDDGAHRARGAPAPPPAAAAGARPERRRHGADAARRAARRSRATPSRVRFNNPPRAGLLFDLDTGRVLWRRNPTRVLPIASLTKMMTALLVADRVPRGRAGADHAGGAALPRLGRRRCSRAGKRDRRRARCCTACCCRRATTPPIALAQRAAGGSVRRFVRLMNQRARPSWACACTRFSSPTASSTRGNHSCAARPRRARAARCCATPRLARIVAPRARPSCRFPIKGGKLYLYNNNPLLRRGLPRDDRRQDGLHGRRGPLPRRHRAARAGPPRRRPAALARTRAGRRARCSTAGFRATGALTPSRAAWSVRPVTMADPTTRLPVRAARPTTCASPPSPASSTRAAPGSTRVRLRHRALPERDLADVTLRRELLGARLARAAGRSRR